MSLTSKWITILYKSSSILFNEKISSYTKANLIDQIKAPHYLRRILDDDPRSVDLSDLSDEEIERLVVENEQLLIKLFKNDGFPSEYIILSQLKSMTSPITVVFKFVNRTMELPFNLAMRSTTYMNHLLTFGQVMRSMEIDILVTDAAVESFVYLMNDDFSFIDLLNTTDDVYSFMMIVDYFDLQWSEDIELDEDSSEDDSTSGDDTIIKGLLDKYGPDNASKYVEDL